MTVPTMDDQSPRAAVEPRIGPGAQLREAREARRLTVEAAASQLRIDVSLLRALEADEYDNFAAPIFVTGHLRASRSCAPGPMRGSTAARGDWSSMVGTVMVCPALAAIRFHGRRENAGAAGRHSPALRPRHPTGARCARPTTDSAVKRSPHRNNVAGTRARRGSPAD